MRLELRLQSTQNLHRLADGRLDHVDLLEAARSALSFSNTGGTRHVGGGTDAAEATVGQRGLEQVGRVQRATAGGAGADDGVDLVDEQDAVGLRPTA